MHDATDFPERFTVPLTVVEILQNPIGPMRPQPRGLSKGPEAEDVPNAFVAFALGGGAFRAADHTIDPAVYDARYCERLNKLISAFSQPYPTEA